MVELEKAVDLSRHFRQVNLALLSYYLVLIALMFITGSNAILGWVLLILSVFIFYKATIICPSYYGKFKGGMLALLTLMPIFNVLILVHASESSSQVLKRNGIRFTWFGPKI